MARPGMRSFFELPPHGPRDFRVQMPEEEGTMSHPVVDQLLTIHRPLPRPFGPLDVQGEGGEVSDVVGDAAGDDLARPLEELMGGGMGIEVQGLDSGGLTLHWISSQGSRAPLPAAPLMRPC